MGGGGGGSFVSRNNDSTVEPGRGGVICSVANIFYQNPKYLA